MANVVVLSGSRSSREFDQAVQAEIAGNKAQDSSYSVDSTISRNIAGFDGRVIQSHYYQNGDIHFQREVIVKTSNKDIVILFTRLMSDSTNASKLRALEASIAIR